ncbi:MAG TPA: discoidin domain-containing protein [Pyrinomonadaceae bacterium]|nr:discoidin domain-containing protein [Pyrinomonadaceae bacterium]
MKRCPKCNRKYKDDTLKFCLEDGAALSEAVRDSDPPATEMMPRGGPTLKPAASPTIPSYPDAGDFRPSQSDARATNPILTAGVVAIVLLLVALVGIAAYFVIKQTSGDNSAKTNPSSSPGSRPTVREDSSPTVSSPGNNTEIASSDSQTGTPLKITPSSSSVRLAVQANTYYPANAIDGKRSTAWIEGVDGPGLGEWIRFDFDREINLHRILIQPGYFKSPAIWAENNRIQTLTAYFSNGTSRDLTFTDRMDSQKVDIGSVRTKWVKFVIKSVYYGTDPDTAISEMAFEWD